MRVNPVDEKSIQVSTIRFAAQDWDVMMNISNIKERKLRRTVSGYFLLRREDHRFEFALLEFRYTQGPHFPQNTRSSPTKIVGVAMS